MDWKKLFNNNYVLKYIQYYNLIFLVLYTLGCYIFLFDYQFYIFIYQILVAFFGLNISSQIFVGYLLSRLKFCKWQTLAFLFNVIINILGITLKLLSHFFLIKFDLIIITVVSTILLTYLLVFIFFNKKSKETT